MAIDPSISLGVKTLELPNQLAQYGQLAQLQGLQNQNQLHQLQMQEAQATAQERNALRQLNPNAPDYEQQLFRVNPQLGIAYRKEAATTAAQKALQSTHEFELKNAKAKFQDQAKRNLSANPSDDNVRAWGQDAVLQGISTQEEAAATVQQLLQLSPEKRVQVLAQSGATAGELKPAIHVGPSGAFSTTPFSNVATPVAGAEGAFKMTEAQRAANAIAQQRANIEGQRLALDRQSVVYQPNAEGGLTAFPSKLAAGETPRGRAVMAAGPGIQPFQVKPSEAEGAQQMSLNQQRSIIKGALKAVSETPDAFGYMAGTLPESARARMASPEENTNRSYLFNVVSGVIKERAGTAQSAAEAETLNRFLPTEKDDAPIIKSKLEGFEKYLTDKESGTTKRRPAAAAAITNPQFPGFSIGKP